MNVQITPAGMEEIALLRASGYRGAGFLLGSSIGRFVLLERLLPLDFDSRGGNAVCGSVYSAYGQRLQGTFFCRKPPFALDWFIGDLVLVVRPGQIAVLTCELPAGERKARFVPLLEDKEGKWRI
jgi:hypothetical protein